MVNNLNGALAWGLVPLFLVAHDAEVGGIGLVAGLYPAVWGVAQVRTGHWSDRIGRKPPIVGGMLLQAAALVMLALSGGGVGVAAIAGNVSRSFRDARREPYERDDRLQLVSS